MNFECQKMHGFLNAAPTEYVGKQLNAESVECSCFVNAGRKECILNLVECALDVMCFECQKNADE